MILVALNRFPYVHQLMKVLIVLVWNAILKLSFSMHDTVCHQIKICDGVLSLFATSLLFVCYERRYVKTLIIIIVVY